MRREDELTWDEVEQRLSRETTFKPEDVKRALAIIRTRTLWTPERALDLGFQIFKAGMEFDKSMDMVNAVLGQSGPTDAT